MNHHQHLCKKVEEHWSIFFRYLEELNKRYPKTDTRWEMDENTNKVRRVKLPDMEWEQFEEPNDELL